MYKEFTPGFADLSAEKRRIRSTFLKDIDNLVDWRVVSNLLHKSLGKEVSCGPKSYSPLSMFKMSLLQTWYGLSDYEIEDQISDRISFSKFCRFSMDSSVPDHSTLSRFRTKCTELGIYEKLFKLLNKQLAKHNILVKTGAIVDASIIDTPLKPKGKTNYEVTEDREKEIKVTKVYKDSVDKEASWIKKANDFRYGYKKHHITNLEGLVLGVKTTKASTHDTKLLEELLEEAKLEPNTLVQADKGYKSKVNDDLLKSKNLRNGIMHKATRNKPLTEEEQLFNKEISKTRFKIERTFGSIKRWFNGGIARYRGLNKMHTQNILEAICYNLYRAPRIDMS